MMGKLERGLLILTAILLSGMWVFFLWLWGVSCGGQIVGVIKPVGDLRVGFLLLLSMFTDIFLIVHIFERRGIK